MFDYTVNITIQSLTYFHSFCHAVADQDVTENVKIRE
jgi:hypothetical protein